CLIEYRGPRAARKPGAARPMGWVAPLANALSRPMRPISLRRRSRRPMPEITSLSAERRALTGKGAARATRRMGRVPGIIYGGEHDPMPISLEPRELSRALAKRGFLATIVEVKIDDAVLRTLPRDVQYHPATDAPLHVDLMRVAADTQVT